MKKDEKRVRFEWKDMNKRWWGVTLSACIAVAFYVALTHLGAIRSAIGSMLHFFLPVIIGLAIACVANPFVNFFRRKVFRRIRSEKIAGRLSVLIVFILILALLFVLLVSLLPQLLSSIVGFIENLDGYVAGLQRFVQGLDIPSQELETQLENLLDSESGVFGRVISMLTQNIGTIVKASTNIGSSAFNWLIGFILAIYLLMDKVRIKRFFSRLCRLVMSDSTYEKVFDVWGRFKVILTQYIVFEILDALIVGVSNYIFMKITGMPYALLVSVVVGVANLAPTFGPIAGAAIGAFILLLVEPILVVWFLIFTVVLQTIDGYIIKPKLFGDALNVPSILILVAIIVGGRMFGVVGMLLAIPAAAILEYIYRELLIPWLRARRTRRYGAPEAQPNEREEAALAPAGDEPSAGPDGPGKKT